MAAILTTILVLLLGAAANARNAPDTTTGRTREFPLYEDFHYPEEEPAERAQALASPITVLSVDGRKATLAQRGIQQVVSEGMILFDRFWHVLAVYEDSVVLERAFARWGLLAFLSAGGTRAPVYARKSVGELATIAQPWFNATAAGLPHYFADIAAANADLPLQHAARLLPAGAHGEMSFAAAASVLAPQRDYVALGNAAQVAKFAVTHAGRVKCAIRGNTARQTTGGIAELVDQHARAPDAQKTVFDPADHLAFWPRRFANSKTGLVGGHLNVANVGAFTAGPGFNVTSGFDLVAFSPAATGGPAPLEFATTVLVRLREQHGVASWDAHAPVRYFEASNRSSAPVPISSAAFYTALAAHVAQQRAVLSPTGMDAALPGADGRRQMDTVRSGLLSSLNNYVGNQANYGFGATYWSYGREDNGSLPLNWLSVDAALLEWGQCGIALRHVAYYFDNYVNLTSGDVDYYTWGSTGDSVGDTGRLAGLYVKASQLCGAPGAAFAARYYPHAAAFGRQILRLRAGASTAPGPHKGLVVGPPEHDWFSINTKYFFSNNVWLLRGENVLGAFLLSPAAGARLPPGAAALGKQLLADAAGYRADVRASVAACAVRDAGGALSFLPPYVELNATPYPSMHASREASYSNFRFYSEALLADVLPREVEGLLLDYHNTKGGRLGGASRWQDHLDDMPTAGWGYGALTNNRTLDFLALLYGHAANYQSRGSFHSTEQLSFLGEGPYRSFLHFDDPIPPATTSAGGGRRAAPAAAAAAFSRKLRRGGAWMAGYFGAEQDVSFCVVTQVLVARLTRWQLVFEDTYRPATPAVWLARGAPKRWFNESAGGFSVHGAPTTAGTVGYNVTVSAEGSSSTKAEFAVSVVGGSPSRVLWKLRWPGTLAKPPTCDGCEVVACDAGTNVCAVRLMSTGSAQFRVSGVFEG